MKSLVTGGAGFIGSHVTNHLIDKGHSVTVLDDLSGGFAENIGQKARFVNGSVTDDSLVRALFESSDFDYVFHLAAYAAEGLSHHIRRFNYDNNMGGSASLISQAIRHDVRRFVFTSSIAVYGEAESPVDESTPTEPIDPYGIAKRAVEQDLAAARRYFGLDYTIFRPHNVYGEHQNLGDRYRNVIGIFMNQIMNGEEMTIFGDGSQKRAFSYIADVAPTIASSIDIDACSGQTYNIGADQPFSVARLATTIAAVMGVPPRIRNLPMRDEVHTIFALHDKVNSLSISHEESTPLEIGLERMAGWAKKVGPRKAIEFDNIEVMRNLPAGWESSE